MAEEQARGFTLAVGDSDIDRRCQSCGVEDDHPRHTVAAARRERQAATLANGVKVPVEVPVDAVHHIDCHAEAGCDHCSEVLEHNKGNVRKARGFGAPAHLVELEPWEFAHPDENGVMKRIRTKGEAREHRLAEHNDPALEATGA